ncbi:MAG: AAA family ATPase [Deltaproteobacteria bacterium]|nr:AAA family ATPase [Deltaproteobacteria bacterium]
MKNKEQKTINLKGKTITFYSYKGGVGRTMSLVNIACLMAKQHKKVLIIDWDLEAPGLHSFFKNSFHDEKLGLVDLIIDFITFLKEDVSNDDSYVSFLEANINKYISKNYTNRNSELRIDIIKAGKFDGVYTDKLNSIDWIVLYKDAPAFFRSLAQFLEKKYDYILIDSRTGLADTSGICTLLLPQILVLVFTLNNQNLNGVLDIARQCLDYRFDSIDYRNLTILPLPSRIDDENSKELAKWIKKYREKFEDLLKELYLLDECKLENYFNIAKIPYKPIYAYGENIPVLNENVKNDLFISYHYSQFLKVIEDSVPIWDILSSEQVEANINQANLHFKNGIRFNTNRNYEKACIEFEKSCELYETNDLAFLNWGNAIFNLGILKNDVLLYEKSFDKFEIATELNPQNDSAFCSWGNALFNLAILKNDKLLCEQSYKKYILASKINPQNDSAFYDSKIAKIMNVPKEIWEQGPIVVNNYLEALEKGATRLNEARIIILGDKGAGKTSIARRLINPDAPMPKENESTSGVNTTFWKLEQENISVRIWDFAGHVVTHAVHQFFLSERCLYLIVYDGRTEGRNRLEYWLNHMKNFGGDSQAIILVNKRDQHFVDIPINYLKERYPIAGFYSFSIKDDSADLETFREEVSNYIKNNPSWGNQVIPTDYYDVKDELEELFEKEKGREYITKDEFDKIARKHDIKNNEELLKDLHCLGVSLWFKNMEAFNTLVLNPEWISDGVYKIINWVNEEGKHSLTINDFATVFKTNEDRYPKEKHEFLFKLMMHYELAYETDEGNCLIIPHLLQEDRIENLYDFPLGESLMLRYKSEQPLPANTISRFIVRHNQEIKKYKKSYLVWRYGVVLENDRGSIALVREEDRTISVTVKGKDKTNYISILRTTLNDIFNSYKSEKPELQYRIEGFGQIPDGLEENNPLWLTDIDIFNYHQREKPYYDVTADQNIPMEPVVNIYKIEAENVITGGQGNRIIKPTFNFHDCNIGLQGNLNELAQLLTDGGKKEEAKELENAAKALEKVENSKTKEEVKKKGIANRLRRLVKDLEDENSKLHKTVKGIKNGVTIAKDISKGYNSIAQWVGSPQVPTPFLK